MTVMALMAVRRFARFTPRPRAPGSTCNVADPDDAPPAMSVSGTSPVSCSSTEAGGNATRPSPAWRRRACRSCRSTVCSATAPQKRSTRPASPAASRTRSRFWISPTDGSFLPFSTSDRCEDEHWPSLASASRLNPWAARSRRTSAPSSARREVAGSRGSAAAQAGRLLRSRMKAGPALFATCRTSSPLDGKPANKLSCPLQTARCGSNTRTVPPVRTVPFCEEAPCSGTRCTNR
jgi:hypothetical protein